MKKIIKTALLAVSSVVIPAASCAQESSVFYRMVEMTDPGVTSDTFTYTYDEQGRLSSVLYVGDSRLRYDYEYNDKGQCVKETWNLDYNFVGKYYVTSVTEYTYDDDGHLATSAIFNNPYITNPMSRPTLGVKFYYSYNENGQLVDKDGYSGETKDVIYSRQHFIYDENGLLVQDDTKSYAYSGEVSGLYRTTYTYDQQNRLVEKAHETSASVEDVNTLVPSYHIIYVYAADGNLQERYRTGAIKDESKKYEKTTYVVDEEVAADRVIYPIVKDADPIYEYEHYDMIHNQLVGMDEWRIDNADVLQLMHAWEYDYEEVTGIVGVNSMTARVMLLRGAEIRGNELCLIGVEKVANLMITDVNGRIVKNIFGAGNRVNISDLAAGVYLVATEAGAAKFVR